jgi:hypothetical protein
MHQFKMNFCCGIVGKMNFWYGIVVWQLHDFSFAELWQLQELLAELWQLNNFLLATTSLFFHFAEIWQLIAEL